jgi:hypothetical protein
MDHDRPTESGPDEPAASAAPEPATRPRATRPLSPEAQALAAEIATALGETEPDPVGQIARAVDRLGPERTRAFLAQVQEIEAGGGQMLPDGSRRRTPGGLFFLLLRRSADVSRRDKVFIFPHLFQDKKARAAAGEGESAGAAPAPVAWTDDTYRALAQQLQQHSSGRATTVKITVIGRPGTAIEQGQAVVLALVSEKVPALAKGLPEPPVGTRYTVFVARKPWATVAEALAADAEDAAIIEGYAALDPRVEGIAVYATSATTKRLQAAKRAAQSVTTP